jgi:hypothetical protein
MIMPMGICPEHDTVGIVGLILTPLCRERMTPAVSTPVLEFDPDVLHPLGFGST